MRLRFRYRMRHNNLTGATGFGSGPEGRIEKLRQIVTALVRHERLEGTQVKMTEARGYAERLIQLAIKNGDTHAATMEMADFWLLEKDLVHKLFKVLAPRYRNYSSSFTQVHILPKIYPAGLKPVVLELKGNPYPPVLPKQRDSSNYLTNILLDEAKKAYRIEKYKEIAEKMNPSVDSVESDLHDAVKLNSVDTVGTESSNTQHAQ